MPADEELAGSLISSLSDAVLKLANAGAKKMQADLRADGADQAAVMADNLGRLARL